MGIGFAGIATFFRTRIAALAGPQNYGSRWCSASTSIP